MVDGEVHAACDRFDRCARIQDLLITHFPVLETLTPSQFHEFRPWLGRASGYQSAQFREIEFLSGLKERGYLDDFEHLAGDYARLAQRLDEPSLWDAFLAALGHRHLDVCDEHRRETLLTIARSHDLYPDLWRLNEAMLCHDASWSHWRGRHATLAERQIGYKPGTGGSEGVKYLRDRQNIHFFPELWDVRGLS